MVMCGTSSTEGNGLVKQGHKLGFLFGNKMCFVLGLLSNLWLVMYVLQYVGSQFL